MPSAFRWVNFFVKWLQSGWRGWVRRFGWLFFAWGLWGNRRPPDLRLLAARDRKIWCFSSIIQRNTAIFRPALNHRSNTQSRQLKASDNRPLKKPFIDIFEAVNGKYPHQNLINNLQILFANSLNKPTIEKRSSDSLDPFCIVHTLHYSCPLRMK